MKKKSIVLIACFLILAMNLAMLGETGVAGKSANPSKATGKAMKITKKTNYTTDEMISGYNSFALRSLREAIAGEKKGKNVMISPASLMFALDMAAMGAKGKTYSQMASLFGKGATKRDLLNFAVDYRKKLENAGMVNIANSLWINEDNLLSNGVKINEAYLNLLRKYFFSFYEL